MLNTAQDLFGKMNVKESDHGKEASGPSEIQISALTKRLSESMDVRLLSQSCSGFQSYNQNNSFEPSPS
jgi:hypothetical protein